MQENYSYPLEMEWSADEIVRVMRLYNLVEAAYEQGVDRASLLEAYREFKQVVRSKILEKQLDKQFEAVSGYSIYHCVQNAEQINRKLFKMA